MQTQDFSWALTQMIAGEKVYNSVWNGNDKQVMYVAAQYPDANSKMTMPYLYMCVEKEGKPIVLRPWMPSMLDLFSDTWEILPS